MTKTFTNHAAAALVAGTMIVSVLAGCGTQGMPTGVANVNGGQAYEAEATSTLMKGLARVHSAIFAKLDKDGNKFIDEYEAGPNITMADFKKADKGRNNKLTYTEFKNYAITNLFFFKDSPKAFSDRFRKDLKKVFDRLDNAKRDGVLVKNETSLRDMQKLGLTFEYPRLNITVKVNKINKEIFTAADKTGDGVLGQAEFEDLYFEMVIAGLGGAPGSGGDTPPPPAPGGDTPPAPGGDVPPAPPAPEDPSADPAADPAPTPKHKKKKKEDEAI